MLAESLLTMILNKILAFSNDIAGVDVDAVHLVIDNQVNVPEVRPDDVTLPITKLAEGTLESGWLAALIFAVAQHIAALIVSLGAFWALVTLGLPFFFAGRYVLSAVDESC